MVRSYTTAIASPYLIGLFINILHAREIFICFFGLITKRNRLFFVIVLSQMSILNTFLDEQFSMIDYFLTSYGGITYVINSLDYPNLLFFNFPPTQHETIPNSFVTDLPKRGKVKLPAGDFHGDIKKNKTIAHDSSKCNSYG